MKSIKSHITQLLKSLNEGVFEKEHTIALSLLSAMAGESIFLLGPPGVAKSLVARRLKLAFKDADAFEYLMSKSSKGEKGQYFTPRYVIDMCVKMLNPQENETMIDTAAGSCGFPVHTIFHVWKQILKRKGLSQSHLFTLEQKPVECTDYVNSKVFAIDFDEKAVRVARTLNLIAGDGQTNVLHLNTLDYERWDEVTNEQEWQDTYYEGWKKLRKLRAKKNSDAAFSFDILMANPPFAGDIKESRMIAKYGPKSGWEISG